MSQICHSARACPYAYALVKNRLLERTLLYLKKLKRLSQLLYRNGEGEWRTFSTFTVVLLNKAP